MTELDLLIRRIKRTPDCAVAPPMGMPALREQDRLPDDLAHFYRLCGGVRLFESAAYPIGVVGPDALVRSNPVIVGSEAPDDITDAWYIVARSGAGEMLSIDFSPGRLGRCYDSFWDGHGIAGSCPIVATSFSELLRRLFADRGGRSYWLGDGDPGYGDAYDET
jgi:antitoxin YokJ